MAVFTQPGGKKLIKWDPGDEVDWTTPNIGGGIDDEYCGNCGLDAPGRGCPRDCDACYEIRGYCGHLEPEGQEPRDAEGG